LDFYDEHEGKRYCVLHYPGEDKKVDVKEIIERKLARKNYDFSGTIFPALSFEGGVFDANTYFTGAIFMEGASFAKVTFGGEETNFSGAKFSGRLADFQNAQFTSGWTCFRAARFSSKSTNFHAAQFSGERTDFSEAQFSSEGSYFYQAQFGGEGSYFYQAQFGGERTDFNAAQFSGRSTHFMNADFSSRSTEFSGAKFSAEETDFSRARFKSRSTDFRAAQFNGAETRFNEAAFLNVFFGAVTFRERITFWGSEANPIFGLGTRAWFDEARIEKPELLTFHTVLLHPGWFVNTDVRKVGFTDVKWYGMPGGPKGTLDEEIDALEEEGVESPRTLLAQACQRLAANADENRDYRLANDFYYWAMDALRKAGWRKLGLIRTLYWALSGYGVRAARAFLVLGGICAVFAGFYMLLGPDALRVSSASSVGQSLEHGGQAVVYSLSTIARLNPEPKPQPGLFQFLVAIEGILGPIQIALLALAVRRKVMR
jgi:uncharacterized protein YjbI with pentapeptide repeats